MMLTITRSFGDFEFEVDDESLQSFIGKPLLLGEEKVGEVIGFKVFPKERRFEFEIEVYEMGWMEAREFQKHYATTIGLRED